MKSVSHSQFEASNKAGAVYSQFEASRKALEQKLMGEMTSFSRQLKEMDMRIHGEKDGWYRSVLQKLVESRRSMLDTLFPDNRAMHHA